MTNDFLAHHFQSFLSFDLVTFSCLLKIFLKNFYKHLLFFQSKKKKFLLLSSRTKNKKQCQTCL